MSTDTNLTNLVINKLTSAQYDTITPNTNELYMITDEVLTSDDVITSLGYTPSNVNLSNLSSNGKLVIDGGWVHTSQDIISSTSVSASSNLSKTVTLPNDGHYYEVLFRGSVQTGTSSSNVAALYIVSKNYGDMQMYLCSSRTRSNSFMQAAGSCTLIMKYGSNNLEIVRNSSWNGTASLTAVAYRRIGSNT